jgi:valyl-tRNA synthetase
MKLPKTYEPHKYEKDMYALWEEQGAFEPKNRGSDTSYSIVVPPPNANGNLHIGHGLTLAIEDIAVRYHRMKGEAALLLPGADHAGFETWVVYEKYLTSIGKSRFDYTREELYKQIWGFVDKNKDNYQTQFRKLGASVDWSRYVYTLDKKIVDQAYASFEKMWNDGLIYRAEKLVNFCTYHGTGFADIEVSHKETPGHLWHIRYPLTDGEGEIVIATTRPETMLGDTAVAVHPEDKRYKKFIGKTVTLPLTGREVPIIADDYVDQSFGTGAVKITPAHDINDFDMAERHSLPFIKVIDHEGRITSSAPSEFVGLDVSAARDKTVNALVEQGSLAKKEEITHSVAHCYKCGTVIEPLLREQWFIKIAPLAKPAIAALKAKKIAFYPENKNKQLITYLENLRDWNISRQIAWGIPIPAFQSADEPEDWIFDTRVDKESITVDGKVYHRDHDVFDTWYSSASWPYATLDFPDGDDFNKFYPLSMMETGADILYPWVSRMLMLGLYNTGQIPFESVYLHGLIQDEHGQKMSKSKGNVVNPMDKVDEFGSDAFRMGIISGESAGNNRPYDQSKVIGARNFTNKLWNIARFIQEQTPISDAAQELKAVTPADHWLLTKLQHTTKKISKYLDANRFSEAYDQLYHFVWDDFADWYIEASKSSKNEPLLRYALENILKLSHPFAPFTSETIWQKLKWSKDLLITSSWPNIINSDTKQAKNFEDIKHVITESRHLVRSAKLKKPILLHSSIIIDENKEVIARLAHLGDIVMTDTTSGLKLTNSPIDVWLDISQEQLTHFKDDLTLQKNTTKEEIDRLTARLNNKGYVASAPEKIVHQTRTQLKEAQNRLEQLTLQLERL